jgi:glycogen debranching enzyme
MSYHNGSVWPHDNAIMTYGLSRYGRREAALKMLASRFDASLFVDLHRMPELFCGFPRRPGEGPTLYPVACAPQSWAAASVFMLLQACLGLPIRGSPAQIGFSYPVLATFLQEVRIRHLCVGQGSVDLLLRPHADDITISIDHRAGDVEVFNVK